MAGPSVMVRVLGDASNLAKAFQTSGEKAKSAASTASSAFGSMLSTINRTGVLGPFGDALATVNDAFDNMVSHGKNVSDVMLGAGGALVGVGTAFAVLGSKEKAAHQQLAAAIDATGQSFDTYGKQIDEAIKHEEKYGNSSVQTQQALQALTQATHDPQQALNLLGEATDLAAAKHEDLSTAATDLGKVYNGNTKLLKAYGIVVDAHTKKTKDGQTATQALAAVLKGQAAASADTFSGHLKAVTTTIEDQVSVFGEKYGPALQGAGAALTGLGAAMKIGQAAMGAFKTAQEGATAATDAMSASEDAAAVSEGLALWPILLIVAAVAALIAIGVLLYKNWNTVWTFLKGLIMDVWNWIKVNWPLLLGILLGPFGLAVGAIIRFHDQILGFLYDVVVNIGRFFAGVGNAIVAPFAAAWNWIASHFNIANLVSTIIWVWGTLTGYLTAPFHAAFNAIADLWNGTVGSLSFKVPGWVPGLGGQGFSMPKIPHMAQGGLITGDGLIYAHAGEAIIPAPAATRQGPAVVIQNANFSTELDVDLFMARAAWAVKSRAM